MGWNECVHRALLTGAAACLCAGLARAGDTAYVNMEAVFEGYYKTVRANIAFEQKKKDFEGRVDILRDELKGMVSDTKKADDEASNELLSNEAREEARNKFRLKMERLRSKEDEFGQYRRSGMADLNRSRLATEEELIKDISDFVRNYCKGKGYKLVYDINGRSLNRMPVVLVYPTEEEITPAVLTEINKGHEDELKQATAELEAIRKAAAAKATQDNGKAAGEAAPAAPETPAPEAPAAEAAPQN
jgi:Skp family chaperone for outer membrane proteins